MSAKILLIETATDNCSVGIAVGNETVVLREEPENRSHIAVITLLISACCKESGIALKELDAVAVSKGPGAYTSLRTGASVAKGLCYALDIPLLGVDTLEALAWGSRPPDADASTLLLPMLDARREEIWVAAYNGLMQCLMPPTPVIVTDNGLKKQIEFALPEHTWHNVLMSGSGLTKINIEHFLDNTDICSIKHSSAHFLTEIAQKMLKKFQIEDISLFEPFYMKPPGITQNSKNAHF